MCMMSTNTKALLVIPALLLLLVATASADFCKEIKPACVNGTCTCRDTRCQFVRGINNDSCAQCCRGHMYDDGRCAKCIECTHQNNDLYEECQLDGQHHQCVDFGQTVRVEECQPSPGPPETDPCADVKPNLDKHGSWICNDTTSHRCIFVRGSGANRSCTRCCEGFFFEKNLCAPCGTCSDDHPEKNRQCQLDGNDKVCQTNLTSIKPTSCPAPHPEKMNKGKVIGICFGVFVIVGLGIFAWCVWKRCKGSRRDGYRPRPRPIRPPIQNESDHDAISMDFLNGGPVDKEHPHQDPNAPGYH